MDDIWHTQNIKLPIAKEIDQSHTVKSTDPNPGTVKGLFVISESVCLEIPALRKALNITATFLLDF